ncbi:hypothetical protein [Allobaculum sp. Allo2]|uniref:hypothetical protein n=1 Tax=Allobaculum sp. Allo2 TaxID=2853432 RepID=UPI001F607431|nr:hypothetical protein [Allobaculum sp. Allo2]UNT92966.1 hypothetical protein KWG61_13065 [Allobaculum sp. Allo2]
MKRNSLLTLILGKDRILIVVRESLWSKKLNTIQDFLFPFFSFHNFQYRKVPVCPTGTFHMRMYEKPEGRILREPRSPIEELLPNACCLEAGRDWDLFCAAFLSENSFWF